MQLAGTPVVAHLLRNPQLPAWLLVLLAAVALAAIAVGLLHPRRRLRLTAWAVLLACLATYEVLGELVPGPPVSTVTRLAFAAPPAGGPLVTLRLCGWDAAGRAVPIPGTGARLLTLLDGTEVAVEDTPLFTLQPPPGTHTLRVELVTESHQVYSPEVYTETQLTAGSSGADAVPPACPG